MENKKVYDDRTDKTLFKGTELKCMEFIDDYLERKPDDIEYIWIGNIDSN
ncbi:hypothetical protein MZM54_04935 [[Brevibacterium] frigoritolerans]|nr:hypothetical protein [Peribacillus frigoritolerans]